MKHLKVSLAVGLVALATRAGTQSASAFKAHIPVLGGQPIHEGITNEALGFMRPDVLGDMDGEHAQADVANAIENRVHFDGCSIKEGSELINSLYHDTIDELDPANEDADPWQAADDFGFLTHPSQDFYAHSNWVETGQDDLVDSGLGFRAVPEGWSQIRPDVIVAEGEMDTLPAGWSVHRDPGSLVPTVTTDTNQTFKALVSGYNDTTPFPLSDNCADPITLNHSELNKDEPGRTGFDAARGLAVRQTQHEWCRLLNLLQGEKGIGGASLALALWSDPQQSPHPGGSACAGSPDPGPVEVTIGLDKLHVNDDTDGAGSGELNFILDAYTTDFRRSAQHDAAGAFDYGDDEDVQATDFPKPVTVCVKPSETLAMTVQGWDDDEPGIGGNGVYDDVLGSEDEPLRGPTFSVSGDMSPGQHTVSGGNLDATFSVSTNGTDPDGDGLNACDEQALGTDPNNADSDGDGLGDGQEKALGTDPNKADTDGDGLSDGTEVNTTHTDPNTGDSDGDGLSDGQENSLGTDPNKADTDGDGLSDGTEVNTTHTDPKKADTDGDGLNDGLEIASQTDPLDNDSD